MSSVITLLTIPLTSVPLSNQTFAITWRKKSDPDEEANYTNAPNATVDPNGNVISPSPYKITVPDTPIIVKGRNINACGVGAEHEFFICEYLTGSGDIVGSCPPGYTLSVDGSYCFQILTDPAIPPSSGSSADIVKVSNEQWNTGYARIYKPGFPSDGDGVLDVNLVVPHFWFNGSLQFNGGADRNTIDGRLNVAGIWFSPDPALEWIGFARTFNVPTSKLYYIGMSADNKYKISLNGVALVDCLNIAGGPNYNYWNIYPVQLRAGLNLIEMVAANLGSVAGMGAEIYDNTKAELVASTSEADLNILFSTKDLVGGHADLGSVYGWSCAPTYALDVSGGTGFFICKKILTANPT